MIQDKIPIKTFVFIAVIFILGFLVYSNTFYNPFIFDDENYVVDNYEIRDISNFFKDFSGTRYVGFLSFAINYYFGGLNTFGYHLVNIAIHILNAMLVYILVSLTLQRVQESFSTHLDPLAIRILPFSVSILFLVHPIQTQAITYVSQRFTSLATLFYLLSVVLYVKWRQKVQGERLKAKTFSHLPFAISFASAILAMKTKEISFTLPFMIIIYEFTFFNSPFVIPLLRGGRGDFFKRFLYLIPYLLTLIIIPLELFFSGEGFDQGLKQQQLADISNLSKRDYLLTQFSVIVTYIRLLFLPINQNFDYDYPIAHSIFEPVTLLSLLFLLSIFGFAVYLYFRSRITHHAYGLLASFGILWFFITLSVESSIIPIKDVIFEHRVYLPSIGAIIAFNTGLFYGIEYTRERLSIKTNAVVIFLSFIFIFIAIFSAAAYKRNIVWKDAMTMAMDMLNKSPNKAEVRSNLGGLYYGMGLLDKARDELEKAIDMQPDFFTAYNNIGLVYLSKGLQEDAERAFKKAINLMQDYPDAHENLASVYMEKGLFKSALRELETAVMLKASPRLYNKIGVLYLKFSDKDTSIRAFKEAIRLEPESLTPYANMGFAYFDKGDYDKAMEMHEKAIKIDPKFANAHYGLAEVYEKRGIKGKAAEHYKEYIKHADPKEQFVEKARKKIIELEAK